MPVTTATGHWDVIEGENGWSLAWLCPDNEVRTFFIGRASLPWEVAMDAACEFMDRYETSNLPSDILMDRCVRNSIKQG
jgi:hypothetical protein